MDDGVGERSDDECVVKSHGLTESLVRTKLSTSMVKVAGPSLGFSASAFFWRAIVIDGCGECVGEGSWWLVMIVVMGEVVVVVDG